MTSCDANRHECPFHIRVDGNTGDPVTQSAITGHIRDFYGLKWSNSHVTIT